ncbi:MAG TPA: 5-oxoprolinase subunit PxpA [Anaerolineae bacterium]|nr:5-oxoprolinase subunit PxpA [Anaerolineae bacterium]HQJ10391.1 5-oxoprolinase subunit PxpA [Anaerolineae bacterium]HUM35463.1 5-oxoprolinase subunit PxpA [Anaerolineae bacterium]
MKIDLNCDLGESFGQYRLGDDAAMLEIVTSANIACGLHAGDPPVMRETVTLAARRGVAIGAHPGYPDLQGFGRRAMDLQPAELETFLIYQLGALAGFTQAAGAHLTHVKPHGALYNQAVADREIAAAIARAVASFDPTLIVVTLPEAALRLAARGNGLRVALEGFADRAYLADGTLAPRQRPGAVIHDPELATARAVRMITQGEVETIEGTVIPLRVNTLCVHGDTPGAAILAAQLRHALEAAQLVLAPLNEVLEG